MFKVSIQLLLYALPLNNKTCSFPFTEVPDVPTSFTNGAFASRWVALQWMLGFDGNSDLLTLRVRVTRQISGESRVLEIVIGSQDINRYCDI